MLELSQVWGAYLIIWFESVHWFDGNIISFVKNFSLDTIWGRSFFQINENYNIKK